MYIGGIFFVVSIILFSIVKIGNFQHFFQEDDSDGHDEAGNYNNGKWFTIAEESENIFIVTVTDTPQGKTILGCGPSGVELSNRLYPSASGFAESLYKPLPSEIDLDTFDPDNYDENSLPHNAHGATIITGREPVSFSFGKVLHNSVVRCALVDVGNENPTLQSTLIHIPKVEGEHQPIVNVSMTKDWDGLTIHWESQETMTWYSMQKFFLDGSDYSTSEINVDRFTGNPETVSNSNYIGGIAEGTWVIAVWGAESNGYIEHVTWYEFEYTGKDCENPERCKTPVEMTPYATLSWPL